MLYNKNVNVVFYKPAGLYCYLDNACLTDKTKSDL